MLFRVNITATMFLKVMVEWCNFVCSVFLYG